MWQHISVLCLFSSAIIGALGTNPPKWESTCTIKGTLHIPYAEIEEPFFGWYETTTNRSRIDYYGGMVKTFQLTKEGTNGVSIKIAPVTTNEELNKQTCLQVNGSSDNPISIQSLLPDTKDFKLMTTEEFAGFNCDKFQFEEVVGTKKNLYTLWVRYVKSPKYPAARMPIPVRYEMRGYNTLLGSHYDHYYIDYDYYNHETIDNEVFEIDTYKPCGGFPGPGIGHYATFNPMKEFIHPRSIAHVDDEFHRYRGKHGKSYKTPEEHERRKIVFHHNLRYILSTNRAKKSYSLAINHLADRTKDELQALRGYRPSKIYNGGQAFPYDVSALRADIPDQVNWRLQGAVSPVKDQAVCGSCWSFGTIGTIEGAYFLKNGGNLVRLSQQALVDCSWGFGNNGCDGGEDFRVYQWMMKAGGVPTEEEYGQYLGQDGYCHINNVTLVAPITGYVNVTTGNHDALKLAIFKHGPISVAIDASHKSFVFYSHGVYYEPKCGNKVDDLDHAVLAVGYGIMNGELYWLVKNSWSNYWGNDGYVLMSARDNNCGVMTAPTYVTM